MKKVLVVVMLVFVTMGRSIAAGDLLIQKFGSFLRDGITFHQEAGLLKEDLESYKSRLPFTQDLKVYEQNIEGNFFELYACLDSFVQALEQLRRVGGIYTVAPAYYWGEHYALVNVFLRYSNGQQLIVPYKLYFKEGIELIYKIERISRSTKIISERKGESSKRFSFTG